MIYTITSRSATCCSDHQSFLSYSFPASQVFERNGPIADPFYHNSGDLSEREGYDLEQAREIARVELGVVLSTVGKGGWVVLKAGAGGEDGE